MAPSTKVYMQQGGNEMVVGDGGFITIASDTGVVNDNIVRNLRTRVTTANVNAGATLLAAIAGFKYRIVDAQAIAVGGAATTVTTVDILGTQTTSVKLVAYAQASLTQSAVLRAGDSGAAVLADGASFVACDEETAVTIGVTGDAMTVATHVDVNLTYTIEAA